MILTVFDTSMIVGGEVAALNALATGEPNDATREWTISALLVAGTFAVLPVFVAQVRALRESGGMLARIAGVLVLALPLTALVVGILLTL